MQINKHNVSTAIILDKRKATKEGKFPVKLRVTYNRVPHYYGTNCILSEKEFEKVNSKNPRGEYKEVKLKLSYIEDKALDVINGLPEFSFDKFKANFGRKPQDLRNVYHYFDKKIEELNNSEQIGTASSYNDSLKSLKKFTKKTSHIEFKEFSPKKLVEYEDWMLRNRNSISTVGIYLRNLRAVFNMARRQSIINDEQYPFGKGKYQIPTSKNIKEALTIDKIGEFYNYTLPKYSYQDKARDLWFFSYFCNGINIADIARLKFKNISNRSITFIRKKTAKSRKELRPVVAPLTKEIQQIIDKWSNKDNSSENYVFPILEKGMTAIQEKSRIKWIVKQTNKYMQRIADDLGINEKITTYTARHCFSTVLKRSGVSTEFISESLGHNDLKTTENYLDSFEDDIKYEYANLLSAFKRK